MVWHYFWNKMWKLCRIAVHHFLILTDELAEKNVIPAHRFLWINSLDRRDFLLLGVWVNA